MIFNGAIEAAKEEGLRIATGTYKGTGKSGSGNKNKITFPFPPKFLFIEATATNGTSTANSPAYLVGIPSTGILYLMIVYGSINIGFANTSASTGALPCTLKNNVLQWWENSNNSPQTQLNDSAQTYAWIAIG